MLDVLVAEMALRGHRCKLSTTKVTFVSARPNRAVDVRLLRDVRPGSNVLVTVLVPVAHN